MTVATFAMFAADGGALWINASDVGDSGIELTTGGVYAVWAWAPVRKTAQVRIGEDEFSARVRQEDKDRAYGWVQVGETTLSAGTVPLELDVGVMAVVLTIHKSYHPAAALQDLSVFDEPGAVNDRRARTAKHTNTVFNMPHFENREMWESYAESLRRRILLSSGLWPLPERTPLKPKVFGRVSHEDYTVEKVHFEARPGFLVTGNLYRPVGEGPFPAIVCPHGHWGNGRLENTDTGSVPGRAITLARLGAVVFTYDMVGYVDSLQFEHRWVSDREKLWGVHPFAMQLWSSMRAVDFVESLPGVDPERIGCTGASGGGTQTFALMATDPRIKVAAPVNMISSTMQGGCICENAPILRLSNSNMEIGALMAPRPLLLVSATGDWTRETPRVEFPAIRSIYALYGAEDRVANVHIDAGHNYNRESREAMYRFFAKWLLGKEGFETFSEPAFAVEPEVDLRVFAGKESVAYYPSQEEVVQAVIDANREKAEALLALKPNFLRKKHGMVLADILGAQVPEANALRCERLAMHERDGYVLERWIIGRAAVGDAVPALLYRSRDAGPQEAVLLVHGEGKAALADLESGGPGELVRGPMAQGKAVLCIDPFLIGDHHSPSHRTRRLKEGFMDTFQPTETGERVQDVLTAAAFLRARRDISELSAVVGLGDAGVWCLLASAIDGHIGITVDDLNGFDPNDDEAWVERHYVPCIRAVGDLRLARALIKASGGRVGMSTEEAPLTEELLGALR